MIKKILAFLLIIIAVAVGYYLFVTKTGDTVDPETGVLGKTSPESIGLSSGKGENSEDVSTVKQKVPVVIYSSDTCPYCLQAKGFLKKKGVDYQVRDINIGKNSEEMVKRTGQRSIPQIFINRKHIGGYGELLSLDSNGELDKLLLGQ